MQALAPFADGTRWPWALAALDHGRALLAEPADAPATSSGIRSPGPMVIADSPDRAARDAAARADSALRH